MPITAYLYSAGMCLTNEHIVALSDVLVGASFEFFIIPPPLQNLKCI